MRQFLYLCLLAFVVTLSLIIGWRLSDQAMAVIIGVVAGVAASVPTSLLVVWVVLRARGEGAPVQAARVYADPERPAPQVIYVHTTPASTAAAYSVPAPAAAAPAAHSAAQRSLTLLPAYTAPEPTDLNGLSVGSRQFTILGGEPDL